MAERANPKITGFQNRINFRWRKKIIPWISIKRSPYREALLWRYKWVNNYCNGKDVLDVPCGMGWGTSLLKGYRSITGVDISSEAIQEASKRYGKKAQFLIGSMESLNFQNSSFDLIVCLEGIEHVPTEVGESFLQEAKRILRPEGEILLSSPYCKNGKHSGNPYHIYEYQPHEIKELIEKYFEIESVHKKEVDILTVDYIRAKKIANTAEKR